MNLQKSISVILFTIFMTSSQTILADEPAAFVVVKVTIKQTCFDCHSDETTEGDLDLARVPWKLVDNDVRERWVQIYDRIATGEMPPNKEDLLDADRTKLLDVLGESIREVEREQTRELGRGPLRRLTQTEYQDNLRDLLQMPHLDVADRLPEDRHAHGFTKVAELLDMSRVQLAGYLDATEAALHQAVATGMNPPEADSRRFTGTDLFPTTNSFGGREAMFFAKDGWMVPISGGDIGKMTLEERQDSQLELALFRSATWPYYGYPKGFRTKHDGEYRVRFSGRAVRQLPGYRLVPAYDPQPMSFRARKPSGADVSGDVRETGGWIDLQTEEKVFETTILLRAGETFEYSLLGLPVPFIRTDGGFFYDFPPMPPEGHRGAAFQWLEVTGPLAPEIWPPTSHRILFGNLPLQLPAKESSLAVDVVSEDPKADAERLFREFIKRAAKRPIPEEAHAVFLNLIFDKLDEGDSFTEAMLKGYQAFLCSGHFLYLTEPQKDTFSLASRLSHFLWNSHPDKGLREKAADGSLAQPEVLRTEVDRLIADARFDRFVENFTNQWLDLSELRRDIPDVRLYPEYRKDDYLVDSMECETRVFFAAMVRGNLPATTLIDSDFTYLNDRLAAHYGLARQSGSMMRRVELPVWSPYGGLLTQASVLKLTSNGTTTSPVKRGAWVMEKLLGDPPPPPPKSVPAIEPDIRGATTIRELLAKHTASESCSVCHARFDPVGFALESFDIMGAWRDRYRSLEKGEEITGIDRAGHPFKYRIGPEIDSSGRLLSGDQFEDIRELKVLLAKNPRQLARNLLHQFTLYATGTPVRFSDRAEIEVMLDQCEENGYRVRDLLHALCASRIFSGTELIE